MEKQIVYIVYDGNEGEVIKVFDNKEAANALIKEGHEEGWLYDEDCRIWAEEVHSE